MFQKEYTGKTVKAAVERALRDLKLQPQDIRWEVLEESSKGFLGFRSKDARIRVELKEDTEKVELEEPDYPDDAISEPFIADVPLEEDPDPVVPKEIPGELSPETRSQVTPEKEADTETDVDIDPHEAEDVPDVVPGDTPDEPFISDIPLEPEDSGSVLHPEPDHTEDAAMAFLAPLFQALEVDPVVQVEEDDENLSFHVNGDHVGLLIGRRGETMNAIQLLLSVYLRKEMRTHKRIIFDVADYRSRREDTLEKLAVRMADKCRSTGRRVSLDPMTAAERRIIHLVLEKEAQVTTFSEGDEPYRRIVIVPERT